MAQLVEINQVGKREDLRDFISLIDMKEKPLMAMLPKISKVINMRFDWQADAYEAPSTSGIADGKDVEQFENAARNRKLLSNYAQKVRRTAMVGDIAENVSNVAGAKAGELARALDKKVEELSRDIELTLGSDNNPQQEVSDAVPYLTRGLGAFINNSGDGTAVEIPAEFRTPTSSILSADVDGATPFVEDNMRSICDSIFTEFGRSTPLDMVCGPGLKAAVSDFTAATTGDTNIMATVRTFTQSAGEKRVIKNVMVYEGDFNTVRLHTSLLLANADVGANGEARWRGYIMPMEKFGLAFNRAPRIKPLPDLGGGPRALVDAIFGLICQNPLCAGKVDNS